MSRYDGLIIPRSYSEYINKTDAATIQQVLQLSGVLSRAVAAGDNKAVTSDAVYGALTDAATIQQALQLPGVLSGAVAAGDNKAVTSDAVYGALTDAATIQQALQLSGVLSGAVAAGDNKAVKSGAVATALANQSSFIESFRLDIFNDKKGQKIILLGVMEADQSGRAGVNFDISYMRVDVVGRIFATLKADDLSCKYFYLSTSYKPIIIKKTRITSNLKYNVYLVIDEYTPLTRVIINAPLFFTVRGKEVTAIEGTEITCTAVGINDL